MFPFRPSRAAVALLELADAMLAPDTFAPAADGSASGSAVGEDRPAERVPPPAPHPHRRSPSVDRRRRLAPPRPEQGCLAPLTRAGRTRDAARA